MNAWEADIRFREWLASEARRNRLTATGLNAGGQAQSGMRLRYSVKPARPSLGRAKLV